MSNRETLEVVGNDAKPGKSFLDGQLAGAVDEGAYEGEASQQPVAGDSLKALRALAQELFSAEREVARCQAQLKTAEDALEDVKEHRLPDLMLRHELPSFDFVDAATGERTTIKYKSGWRVRMPPKQDEDGQPIEENLEKRKGIIEWFRGIGLGAIVRKEIKIPAGLMADAAVADLMTDLKLAYPDLDPGLVEDINASTLRAQVKRRKDKGLDVHSDIIVQSIHEATVAKR